MNSRISFLEVPGKTHDNPEIEWLAAFVHLEIEESKPAEVNGAASPGFEILE